MSTELVITPTDPIISHPDTVVLDASWLYEPDPPTRDAYKEFQDGPRLPGARFWSLDDISEPHPERYALMLPSPERFARFAGNHGVSEGSHVVIYDSEGIFSAPRTAWTFKVYGHEKVSVIDGGLPRAKAEGVRLETGPPREFKKTTYPVPTVDARAVVGEFGFVGVFADPPEYAEIAKIAARKAPLDDKTVLIDARPAASYESGHIPTSLLFDFPTALLKDPAGFTHLRDPDELKKHFVERVGQETADKVFSRETTVVNTCGGGLSAAINWLQLQSLGISSRLYDEAWGGYSARPETVRITGPNPV
uniref:Rhodanese domain-containing protein n=1 Tax=Kwoniella bestiolae CBS 10118 TaxID=1296100 RepID=A0A1B9G717_9TREE|nr:hypothetical protein I302_04524 [Kwoniella bestiolae CBS 10118]OCF26834.1 hypothetical protein I302_04524 [Kwoniella bestiolae CBS 10118]